MGFINSLFSKSQPLFGYDKRKIHSVKTIKQFMGFINSLFSEWGIMIKYKQKCTTIIKNDKKKTKHINIYVLNYINNINEYI